jgi:hypothetical protein
MVPTRMLLSSSSTSKLLMLPSCGGMVPAVQCGKQGAGRQVAVRVQCAACMTKHRLIQQQHLQGGPAAQLQRDGACRAARMLRRLLFVSNALRA